MRTRIKIRGDWYRPVPWIVPYDCDYCAFSRGSGREEDCPNELGVSDRCTENGEFDGHIFIPVGKEGYEKYCHDAVLHKMNKPDEDE